MKQKKKKKWVVLIPFADLFSDLEMFLHFCANIHWISDTRQMHFTSIYSSVLCKVLSWRGEKKKKRKENLKKGWANFSSPLTMFWTCHHFVARYISIAVSLPLKRHYCSVLFNHIWTSNTGKIHSYLRDFVSCFCSSEQYWRHLASMYLCND